MNRKGFTLVELLAVIVILAVVMLIAVTSVGPLMARGRKSSLGDEGIALIKSADTIVTAEQVSNAPGTFTAHQDACLSLEYLHEKGFFDKGKDDGYYGSVYVDYEDGKYNYYFWITDGTYAYGGVTKDAINPDNAVEYTSSMKDKITSCSTTVYTAEAANKPTISKGSIQICSDGSCHSPVAADVVKTCPTGYTDNGSRCAKTTPIVCPEGYSHYNSCQCAMYLGIIDGSKRTRVTVPCASGTCDDVHKTCNTYQSYTSTTYNCPTGYKYDSSVRKCVYKTN